MRYRQILQHIVENAAKFTEKGSILVQASLLDVDEALYAVLTEVGDMGIGISEVATQNLFQPFMHLDCTIRKALPSDWFRTFDYQITRRAVEWPGWVPAEPRVPGQHILIHGQASRIVNSHPEGAMKADQSSAGSEVSGLGHLGTEDVNQSTGQLQEMAPSKVDPSSGG